jgi:hypothetical protein
MYKLALDKESAKLLVKLLFYIIFALWLVVLPLRSIIYVKRIVKEFIDPPEPPYDYIQPCAHDLELDTLVERKLFNYRSLGVKCED